MICCHRRGLWLLISLRMLVAAGCLLLSCIVRGEEAKARVGSSITPGGFAVYRPDRWGLVNLHLVNPTDEPMELLANTFFEEDPNLQFGRRAWIPPKSRLQSWHPLRLPPVALDSARTINIRTLLMDARQEREVLIRSNSGFLQSDGTLRMTNEASVTGMIVDSDSQPAAGISLFDENIDAVSELVVASRLQALHTRRLTYLFDRQLLTGAENLQALDQLVIADSRLEDGGAELAAIRRWLFGGGYLWVMLDRVDPRVLERLLGDEFVCQVVDRAGLTTVRMETQQAGENIRFTQEYERPVELVRVAVSDVDVEYTVDGWPAAFWKKCGEGRLLVTTLESRGWMRRRTATDNIWSPSTSTQQPPASRLSDGLRAPSSFVVLEAMSELAPVFFGPRAPRLLPATVLEPLAQEYVGYSIPPRGLVIGLLLGFSVLLMGLGAWLSRRRRLEMLGLIGPVLAMAISGVLVSLGRYQRTAVSPMVASVQLVQSISGTDDVCVEGVAGLFSPEAGTATISAQRGGWLLPESSGFQGTTRRMVWTDLDEWHWEHLPETAGVRSATFQTSGAFADRLEARATYGPEGLTGRLHVPGGYRPTDPVLATREGRFGVELGNDGQFVVRADHVLATEQFLAAGLLSDEQDRRRRILEQLLANPLRRDFPAVPHLFFWTDPWDIGFRFDEDRKLLGAALIAVPLRFQRPALGIEVTIAPPLLPYRGTLGPDGSMPSGWWDYQHHTWIEKSLPSETWLRFQIPAVLLPIVAERARVSVQVRGPVGKLTIAGYRQSVAAIVPLKTWIDPVGTLSLDITDTELLNVSADGGLLLRITGGDPDRPELTQQKTEDGPRSSYWQIESLTLELKVKTTDPAHSDSEPAGGNL